LTADGPERFLREVRAAAVLHHPHLLPILAVGLHDGRPAYTTPLAANGNLAGRRQQFADIRAAAGLVEKLARAAAAAHAHGQLHGDLRPQEILFDENDQPQIAGFGLLPCLLSVKRDEAAERGGSPYLAPEQLPWGLAAIDATTDVWALGVILYELLTARRPFDGTAAECVWNIAAADPIRPRRLRPDIDADLEAVVLCCLEKRPADRYPSARALADDLERWRLGQPTAVRPATLTQRILRALRRKTP
jgi:serine/threonine protein kinase